MIRGVARKRLNAPSVRTVTALMYHSVEGTNEGRDPSADGIYSISPQQFADHLDLIREVGGPVTTVCDVTAANPRESRKPSGGRAVVLTFDDGTLSHLEPVLHLLWERDMPGEFFVNPGNAGKHGFLSWSELRGMASAGMSIQSHGYTHRYMDDLDDKTVAEELLRSKRTIEDKLGQEVTVFAAPGGRVNDFVAAVAIRVGYKAVCGSRPGQWRPYSHRGIIPRIAIRSNTTLDEVRSWIEERPFALAVQAGRYRVLQMARRTLGNHMYDVLRARYMNLHHG